MEKSWIFVFFHEVIENCYFKEKVRNFAETISSIHDIRLWQSSSLHLQVHCFPSHSLIVSV